MIRVCDAIMGSGKSQSARHLMNTNPHKRFIYISPYKQDGPEIAADCPDLHFVLPAHLPQYSLSKTEHCKELLQRGCNVACTHELFKRYTPEILQTIREQHYTIIIDEEVAVMEECKLHTDDLSILLEIGYLAPDENGNLIKTEKCNNYKGRAYKDFMQILESRKLNATGDDEGNKYFYWQLPPDLLAAFDDVYILTYMFDCQDIKYMLDISGMEYRPIYIARTPGDGYKFSDTPSYLPTYVSHLSDMIDIYEGDNLNDVGKPVKSKECPLSVGWMSRNVEKVDQLRRNLVNYFTNYAKGVSATEKMWSTYTGKPQEALSRRGYGAGFVAYNKRGSNEYRNRTWLAYCVSIYLPPQAKSYYSKYGITPDEDERALSIMIQWIWRSAIRDGEKISIYIPSERMRNLLKDWMAKVEADATSGRWAQHGQQYEMAS